MDVAPGAQSTTAADLIASLDKQEQIESLVRQIGEQAMANARMTAQLDAALSMNAMQIERLRSELVERDARIIQLAEQLAPPAGSAEPDEEASPSN